MKTIKISISTVFILYLFTGCSGKVFMPYEEDPLCNSGKGSGYCGSVSDVYEITILEQQR